MDNDTGGQKEQSSSTDSDKQKQSAVPYLPQISSSESSRKLFRSPIINGMLAAAVILLGGFMMYHYIGHQLTQLAGISDVRTITPTPSSIPNISPSISPSQEVPSSPTP